MDITFHRCKNHLILFSLLTTDFRKPLLQHGKCQLCGIRAHEQLGQKYRSLLKAFSHLVESRYHLFIDHRKRRFFLYHLTGRMVCLLLKSLDDGCFKGNLPALLHRRFFLLIPVTADVRLTVFIIVHQRAVRIVSAHHILRHGINNSRA